MVLLAAPTGLVAQPPMRGQLATMRGQLATMTYGGAEFAWPGTASGDTTATSLAPVIAGSLGGGLGLVLLGGLTGLSDDRPVAGAAVYTIGVSLGGVLGSHIGRRRPAPLETMLGGSLSAIPLLLMTNELDGKSADIESGLSVLGLALLPVIGAVLGNVLGQ